MWLDSLHHELHVLLTGEQRRLLRGLRHASTGSCASCAARRRSASSSARRTTTRSATVPSATACRPTRTASRSPCVLFSLITPLVFMGEEYERAASVPVLHRPHRPGDRRGDARGPRAEVEAHRRRSRAATHPTRRRARRSSARSSSRASRLPFFRELLALRRELPRELDVARRREPRDRMTRGDARRSSLDLDATRRSELRT